MRFFLLLASLVVLTACEDPSPVDGPDPSEPARADIPDTPIALPDAFGLEDAFARAAPAGGVSAMFMDVLNGTSLADTILAVRVEGVGRTEIHRTQENADGLSEMVPVEGGIPVPANSTVILEPGGLHVMLYDFEGDLSEGDLLDVTLELSSREQMTTVVPVQGL
ncbi:copper chaperone PCu(A)C [Rubrivirga sp.]|uniref:copper chaperone PCu(A)C n=1 Tax=Rubrivirga sp. TaxID=1885344 RepID=UPI003C758392